MVNILSTTDVNGNIVQFNQQDLTTTEGSQSLAAQLGLTVDEVRKKLLLDVSHSQKAKYANISDCGCGGF